ncbi:MAG: hypothetical protein V4722_17805 [Bacteroidota bacterium]
MQVLLLWILFSCIAGIIGSYRKIGFSGALLVSLIGSPVFGIIFTLLSSSNSSIRHHHQMLMERRKQAETVLSDEK